MNKYMIKILRYDERKLVKVRKKTYIKMKINKI